MKICDKCGFENPDSAKSCEQCCNLLLDCDSESSENILEEIFVKQEKAEKKKRILKRIPVFVYSLIYIPIYIKCLIADSECFFSLLFFLFFPLLGYCLLAFKAEALFKFQHILHIDNIDDVEVSDWYVFSSFIAGILLLSMGLFVIISTYISMANSVDVTAGFFI